MNLVQHQMNRVHAVGYCKVCREIIKREFCNECWGPLVDRDHTMLGSCLCELCYYQEAESRIRSVRTARVALQELIRVVLMP